VIGAGDSDVLVVAHQLPERAATEIAARLPVGVRLSPVDWARPWAVDPAAEVLIGGAAALQGAAIVRPAAWPGRLRWLHLRSAGTDEFPDWIFDVPLLTVTRGAQAVAIAEFVLAALLAHEKHLPQVWIHDAAAWQRHALGTLEGRTLGLLGFGRIGQEVARRAVPFGMRVLAHRRTATPIDVADVIAVPLATLLGEADHLVLAAPLTAATRGLLGETAFKRMRPGAHLVNVARGAIVDNDALRAALDGDRLAAATLDVCDPEPLPAGHWLYTHPRVRLSPHVSYSAPGTSPRAAEAFLDNLRCYLAGTPDRMSGQVDRATRY
jgi:phosphoglycerate dehydrogenase-like enzyme